MRNCWKPVGLLLGIGAIVGVAFAQESPRSKGDGKSAAVASEELVEVKRVVERRTLDIPVRYEITRTVGPGRTLKTEHGKLGHVESVFEVTFKDGKEISRKLIDKTVVKPEPAVILLGRSGYEASRSKFTRGRVLTMEATAYHTYVRGRNARNAGMTATGIKAVHGVVAVDPNVIPLGTLLFVEGYGMAIAADTGGAIKGNRIDLCFPTHAEAMAFGRKQVKVHILRTE